MVEIFCKKITNFVARHRRLDQFLDQIYATRVNTKFNPILFFAVKWVGIICMKSWMQKKRKLTPDEIKKLKKQKKNLDNSQENIQTSIFNIGGEPQYTEEQLRAMSKILEFNQEINNKLGETGDNNLKKKKKKKASILSLGKKKRNT